MAKTVFGTNSFTSLDVSKAPHLISDSSLVTSNNGWTDQEGALSCRPGGTTLYSGYSAISCLATARQFNSTKIGWMDGDNVYVNGTNVGTINAGTDMVAKGFGNKFYFLGSDDDKNFIWDGYLLRQHGPWQIDEWSRGTQDTFIRTNSDQVSITAITAATPGVITAAGHTADPGDSIYIDGVVGMTELNGRILTVASSTATTITLDESTFGYTAYTGGGTVTTFGCGLLGEYKYYMVPTVKFVTEDVVLEGKPRGLVFGSSSATYGVDDSYEAESVSLVPTDEVEIKVSMTPDYDTSGVLDTNYLIGMRLYRTKADGADFYLENEWWSDDTDGVDITAGEYTFFSELGGVLNPNYRSKTLDQDLGAVYTAGMNDHGTPPASSLMALVGQRLFFNSTANPTRLYFTHLDGTDYSPTNSFLEIPDVITGIGQAGSVCIVFSTDRMWRVSMLGGVPGIDEIESQVGTTYGNAITTTDLGLLFLRDDGLWSTNGHAPPRKVSRMAMSALSGPKALAAEGDYLVLSGDTSSYVMIRRDAGVYWHKMLSISVHLTFSDGNIYAASDDSVFRLFDSGRQPCTFQTKDFTDYQDRMATRIILDYEGTSLPSVWAIGNSESDTVDHDDSDQYGDGRRRLIRYSIPRWLNHVFAIKVTMDDDGVAYGVWIEAE